MKIFTLKEELDFKMRPLTPPIPYDEAIELLESLVQEKFKDAASSGWSSVKNIARAVAGKAKDTVKDIRDRATAEKQQQAKEGVAEEEAKARLEKADEMLKAFKDHYKLDDENIKGAYNLSTRTSDNGINYSKSLNKMKQWIERKFIPSLSAHLDKKQSSVETAIQFIQRAEKIFDL